MSLVICRACAELIDSDDDPDCFTYPHEKPICRHCRPEDEDRHTIARFEEWCVAQGIDL